MTDGFVRGPGEGERVSPAMTLKVGDKNSQAWSMFEVVDIGPGFDVGSSPPAPQRRQELVDVRRASSTCSPSNRGSGLRATGRAGSRAPGPRWPAVGQAA